MERTRKKEEGEEEKSRYSILFFGGCQDMRHREKNQGRTDGERERETL